METIVDEPAPARLRSSPTWLINQTSVVAQRLVADGLSGVGARRYHYQVLAALEEFGPASQAALGRRTGIDRSDVVAAINELAEQGLVERTQDPTDRRRNTITLTPTGRRQLRRLDEMRDNVQDALLAPLSADERDHLTRLLTRVLDHHIRR
jgi:MarR family transcriptional regulator, lower aerobic nicotinate degradation pathway regulator